MGRLVEAQTSIRTDVETVRGRALDPRAHVRWDLRFTHIEPLQPPRFRYATRLGLLRVEGWGESVGVGRGTALRFGSEDPKALIEEGTGSWTFEPRGDRVRFSTTYDYRPRHGLAGRIVDALFFRPLIGWATRWSFDRLRLWIEEGVAPERQRVLWLAKMACLVALGLVWLHSGLVPKILDVRPAEVDLVARSGLSLGAPRAALAMLGAAEALVGLWLLSARAPRAAVVVASAATVALAALVLRLDPGAFSDPYAGVAKNLGLLASALVVLALDPVTPKASRARRRRA